ncbi:uncharacterized protein LOC111034783 [Myzus persicae]|uniref:uncharacterized protein LOC111034783 n=1 Tax=Myzus persicae TaxID=13164 RepID=UPI000B92FB78|nr:uncharacterized protein LOC111034783 [Myzus persicae]
MIEVVYAFCTSMVGRIFGYLENILLNGSGNSVPVNSATTTVQSMTAIEPAEGIQIDKNVTCRKKHHYSNNDHSSGINNRFKKKETLQKKINFEFGNTDPACYYNNMETAINSSGLYYGIFYENMKCNETKIIDDEVKKFLFFESMRRDIMGTGKNSTVSTKSVLIN